ncbi:MAG: hypothetical protein ACO32I_05970 [Candidatus Limnocylindrus sp.]
MKLELDLDGDREALISPQQLQRDLAFWIEGYYNRERRHSTSGYKNPIDYERVFMTSRILTFVNPRSVSAKSGGATPCDAMLVRGSRTIGYSQKLGRGAEP